MEHVEQDRSGCHLLGAALLPPNLTHKSGLKESWDSIKEFSHGTRNNGFEQMEGRFRSGRTWGRNSSLGAQAHMGIRFEDAPCFPPSVLVSVRTELIFFLVAGRMLCFGLG